MEPRPNILLFGDEEGTSNIAKDFGAVHFPFIERSEEFSPMPFVNKLFDKATTLSNSSILMYTNADILFAKEELNKLLLSAKKQFENFLVVARRMDIEVSDSIEKSSNWENTLFSKYEQKRASWEPNSNDNRWAIDFFAYTRNFWNEIEIPPFLLGVPAFDNWLLHEPNRRGMKVIDATKTLRVIHQFHEYTHGSERKRKMKQYNEQLAGKWFLGNTDKALYYSEYCGKNSTDICFKKR